MIYKIVKTRKRTSLTPKQLIEIEVLPLIKKGNENNIWYKLVIDEAWDNVFKYYSFNWEVKKEVIDEFWKCFENYCYQYRDKYNIINFIN